MKVNDRVKMVPPYGPYIGLEGVIVKDKLEISGFEPWFKVEFDYQGKKEEVISPKRYLVTINER